MPNNPSDAPSPLKNLNKNFIQPPAGLDQANLKIFTQIIEDHPNLHFRIGSRFAYRPPRTVLIAPFDQSQYPSSSHYLMCFFHEIGHALIHQDSYDTFISRLKIERHAWDQAQELAEKYHLPWDSDFVEDHLDTYRNWLHQKSRCPHCGETRYQTPDGVFHCPHCDTFNTPS